MYPFAAWSLPCLPAARQHVVTIERPNAPVAMMYSVGTSEKEIYHHLTHLFLTFEARGFVISQSLDYSTRWEAWNESSGVRLDIALLSAEVVN